MDERIEGMKDSTTVFARDSNATVVTRLQGPMNDKGTHLYAFLLARVAIEWDPTHAPFYDFLEKDVPPRQFQSDHH
eukprot:scaffold16425_cov52-Attheya_sp.AAC.2